MGNFSREPKNRLSDAIAKHYVGVRMQQGVPVLDADWNEMEDLRRHDFEDLNTLFIGNGVPIGSDGFRIIELQEDNNFMISKGLILVKGKKIINESDNATYLSQPNAGFVEALETPENDTKYVVYLDTWEREVDSQEDPDLIDERIGVESTIRIKREWVVRVIEGENPNELPPEPEGHLFCALALIKRTGGNAQITFHMITDLRRLDLNLAENTKSPLKLFGSLGTIIYTIENFSQLLDLCEEGYFNLLRSDLFMTSNFISATPLETTTISAVFNEVMQTARVGSAQAKIKNLNNQDGIKVLEMIYYAQDHFVLTINDLIAGDPAKDTTSDFLVDLRGLLDGGTGGIPKGLRDSVITNKDLKAGIDAQQEINREIGNRTKILPHGNLLVQYGAGPPPSTIITAGQTFRLGYDITFERTTPGLPQTETFDLLPAMDPLGWNVELVGRPDGTVTLQTDETATVQIDVIIPDPSAVSSATLVFQVRSQNNPGEMDTTNREVILSIGSPLPQPNPVLIALLSPSQDLILVGRGGPIGLPGNGVNLKFRFFYLENVTMPEDFTVKFESKPDGTFESIDSLHFQLGGAAGQHRESQIGFQATEAALNGTNGTLKVRMEKDSDPVNLFNDLVINLEVQKG
jgi:hypothetical protein